MEIKELLTDGGITLLVILTLVQIAPIKIDPWSWLAKTIGKFINADITAKLDAHIAMDDKRTADAHRARILHFNNELLRDIPHTKEEFIEVWLRSTPMRNIAENTPTIRITGLAWQSRTSRRLTKNA